MITTRRTILLGLGAGTLALAPAGMLPAQEQLSVEEVLHDPDNPVLGNPDGGLTLVEFFDYQCPYCKANHPAVTELVEEDGNIRFVMKDWPIFGAPSIRAAQLALGAVGQGSYETANSALMATEGKLTDSRIEEVLSEAGVDVEAADASYRENRDTWDGLIGRNRRQAELFGLRGTPTFLVDTRIFPGSMSKEDLSAAIETARS